MSAEVLRYVPENAKCTHLLWAGILPGMKTGYVVNGIPGRERTRSTDTA